MPNITITRRSWDALEEFNERETGRGIDAGATTFHGDLVTFSVSNEVARRLAQLDPDPAVAIMIAIRGEPTVQ